MSVFICPVCGAGLERDAGAYKCRNGHSFDIASQGYVNLMPSDRPHENAGDNPQMMAARSRFLNAGYYGCLKKALADMVSRALAGKKGALVVDAGCGEGYYTDGVARALEAERLCARVAGIDIAKKGVKAAARRGGPAIYAVAGIFSLPFADGSAAAMTSLFAPLCEREFARVLFPGGTLIVVSPGSDHLLGLKRAVYDHPYLNDEKPYAPEGFRPVERAVVREDVTVLGSDIADLFTMTPYFFNTPKKQASRLDGLERLETPVHFILTRLERQ